MREIPLFHGDQWEITVPSLLGIEQDEVHTKSNPKTKLDPAKLLRMDSKDVVQKAQQEMQHLKRHFLVVVFKVSPPNPWSPAAMSYAQLPCTAPAAMAAPTCNP